MLIEPDFFSLGRHNPFIHASTFVGCVVVVENHQDGSDTFIMTVA
jgi:hypothetical protein